MPTESPSKSITLNLNLIPGGVFPGAWRGGDKPGQHYSSLDHYIEVARIAEKGFLDAVFLADTPVWRYRGEYRPFRGLDPNVALAAVAQHTSHIGLIATASTSYNSPYNLARRLSTLDHISKGRAAWNIVATTGDDVAVNFGLEHALDHDERYKRAHEVVEAIKLLWDSWDDDAWVADKETGTFVDDTRIHSVDYVGDYVSVKGPLNLPRSPQGHPVLIQAGSSEDGIGLASRFADAVYTVQNTIDTAKVFRAKIHERARGWGRDPAKIKVLPGLITLVGSTEEEALRLEREWQALHTERYAINALALQLGVPVEALDLDKQLPWDLIPPDGHSGGQQGHFATLVASARRDNLTVRQILARQGGGLTHVSAIGSPEQIADKIETWIREGASDGFNVMPAALPRVAADFVEHVVPILQKRGLFRTEYPGTTLRDTYGLARPEVVLPADRPKAAHQPVAEAAFS
jgi:FMN-dependent oxidoreductase (nitrilotriacetate monooxygenase family)